MLRVPQKDSSVRAPECQVRKKGYPTSLGLCPIVAQGWLADCGRRLIFGRSTNCFSFLYSILNRPISSPLGPSYGKKLKLPLNERESEARLNPRPRIWSPKQERGRLARGVHHEIIET